MGSHLSIKITEDQLSVKTHGTIVCDKNSTTITENGSTMTFNNHSLILRENSGLFSLDRQNNKTKICNEKECFEFECSKIVEIKSGAIYCGSDLYYRYRNNTWKNVRS